MNEKFHKFTEELSEKSTKIYNKIFSIISKLKWIIVIFWFVLAISLAYFAFNFLLHTSMVVNAPKGSKGEEANEIYQTHFPETCGDTQIAVVIKQKEKLDDIRNSDYLRDFSMFFNSSVYADEDSYLIRKLVGYYIVPEGLPIENMIMNYTVENLMSDNMTMIQVELNGEEPSKKSPYVKRMRNFVKEYTDEHGTNGYEIVITGYDSLNIDLMIVILNGVRKIEYIVLPVAILILLYVVQSPVLLIVPVCNIVCIVLVSYGFMYFVSVSEDVFFVAPVMMLSTILATGIDYSLFLLTRFTEEINKKQKYYDAVSNMLRTSGRTVMTSGFVMLLCFFVIAVFPMDVIRFIGVGCGIAVMMTLLIDLTLTPALFLCFPRFFSFQSCCPCSKRCVEYTKKHAKFEGFGDKMWHKFATFQTSKPISFAMFIIALIIMIPFCVFMYEYFWTLDNNQVVPLDSEFNTGFEYIQETFSIGLLYPFHIMILSGEKEMDVFSQEYHDFTTDLIKEYAEGMPYSFSEESLICFNSAGGAVAPPDMVKTMFTLQGYLNSMKNFISEDRSVVNCQLIPTIDPTLNSTELVEDARNHLQILEEKYGYKLLLQGIIVDGVDCVTISMDYFIWVIVILFVIILLLVFIFFKSVLVPIRVVFTTLLTLIFVYGAASLVFCTEYFDGIETVALTNGIYWVVPIISVPVIIGLGLDYDIFLFSRIKEYRSKGYSTDLATVLGVEKTGYLITFCGIIMAVSFSGLFLCNLLVLNVFAFVLVLAVLVDTFVVRILIVPSFVHLFGEINWWPIKHEINITKYEDVHIEDEYDQLDSDDEDEERNVIKERNIQKIIEEEKKRSSSSSDDENKNNEGDDKTPLI